VVTAYNKQRGQALIYGIFVLVAGLAALFFLFNTGQLAREKTKLVNTADAVAYSGGLMNARALNYQAYTNRVMVANTVAIAQLVSLSSWIQYADSYALAGQGTAYVDQRTVKYLGSVYSSNFLAQTIGRELQSTLNDGPLQNIARELDRINWDVLHLSQDWVFANTDISRPAVMTEVANQNYTNDGAVTVRENQIRAGQFAGFTRMYARNSRTRFAEVASRSAARDQFVSDRSWRLRALFSSCPLDFLVFNRDYMDRLGSTTLSGFDQWRASDRLTEHQRFLRNSRWGFPSCRTRQVANGRGSQLAVAAADASSDDWNYRGLPPFTDLSQINPEGPNEPNEPTMLTGIVLTRKTAQTQTSEGLSEIKSTARLNNYRAQTAGSEQQMAAVSTSEVFFQRYDTSKDDPASKDNPYGLSIGRPREIGSLFNPYWQVKLVQSDTNINAAQAAQGVDLQ
jgi:Putative Flp pilus-assembly TadE/G-like